MGNFNKLGMVAAAALLLVVGFSTTSQAAYDSAELKCRSTIAKTFSKAISTGQKTVAGCHKGRDKAGGTADCNILDLANADTKGKFDKAKTKLTDGVAKACTGAGIDNDVLDEYTSCPEPCGTDLALPNPLSSYADLGTCLACVAGEIAQDFGAASQGLPGGVPLSSDDSKCHGAIGKFYGKYVSTILKDRTKCQNTEEKKNGAMDLASTGCATSDLKSKIAKALTKAEGGLDKLCPAATLANLDSCPAVSLGDLKTCLETEGDSAGDDGVTYAYEMPATTCPVAIDSLIRGSVTNSGGTTKTELELGWTGLAHTADLPDNYFISVDVTCPNSEPPCGVCTIDGVSTSGPQYASFTRCANDFTAPCDEPFGPDLDDCGGNQCDYILGPPLPVSSGNNPVCSINRLIADFTGTSEPDAGEGEINITLRTRVYLGGNGLTQPCALCINDATPQDGVKNGTCVGGAADGLSCDIQGFSPSFAPEGTCAAGPALGNACTTDVDCPGSVCALTNGVSLDCPPAVLANISGDGLFIPLELTTGATSLSFDNSCDSPLGALDCACGQCSLDNSLPCRNDSECALAGAGTCTAVGSGELRVPNGCSNLICDPAGNDKGICTAGPTDTFCDGVLDANGLGFIGCSTNADCDVVSVVCGGDCGTCTNTRQRPCFLDPIVDIGEPDTENPVLVSTFCLSPTNNNSVNSVSGTPGPVRVIVDQLTNLRY